MACALVCVVMSGGARSHPASVPVVLPVVKLHLCSFPLLKLAGEIRGSAQQVFDVEEKLLLRGTKTRLNATTGRRAQD